MEKFSRKNWFLLLLFGTIGQIAWSVENMYFGTFVYNTFKDFVNVEAAQGNAVLDTVTLMVQLSGIVATVVTLLAGYFYRIYYLGCNGRFVRLPYSRYSSIGAWQGKHAGCYPLSCSCCSW